MKSQTGVHFERYHPERNEARKKRWNKRREQFAPFASELEKLRERLKAAEEYISAILETEGTTGGERRAKACKRWHSFVPPATEKGKVKP